MDMSAWLSEDEAYWNQGMMGFGSVSPAATRFLYSSVFSQATPVREMYAAFLVDTLGLPFTVERS